MNSRQFLAALTLLANSYVPVAQAAAESVASASGDDSSLSDPAPPANQQPNPFLNQAKPQA